LKSVFWNLCAIRDHVLKAREIQTTRFEGKRINTNSEMSAKDLEKFAPLGEKEKNLLNSAATRMGLSPRAYHRTIKLARTITVRQLADRRR
jgi:magnesium chelatase family protein